MKLSALIKQYRMEHDLSQRQFATICGLTNGYISMLEKELNPKTNEPIVPSITALLKLATGMGMSIDELLERADDMQIDLTISSTMTANPKERRLKIIISQLDDSRFDKLLDYAELLLK